MVTGVSSSDVCVLVYLPCHFGARRDAAFEVGHDTSHELFVNNHIQEWTGVSNAG
jgi:hypothetical protein